MACHVVSVHGSARTAKIQTMRRVQNVYRDRLVRSMRDDDGDDHNVSLPQPSQTRRAKNRRKTEYNEETIKLCLAMQDTLAQIVAIDF